MSTKFTFPKDPKIGDMLEIVSISSAKMPIEIFANSDAEKSLRLIFPNEEYTGTPGGTSVFQITDVNITYNFKCVSVKNEHIWLLENTSLYNYIKRLEARVATLES